MPETFAEPLRVAALMSGYDNPWFVAGGWAIDLFLGRIRRRHKDLDFTIFRRDQLALQEHLAGFELKKLAGPDGGEYIDPWQQGEFLELPIHQVWIEMGPDGWPTLEALLSETEGEEWWWRKNPQIRRPLSRLGRTSPIGVPYLSPEVVLLYKSRHMLDDNPPPNDQIDFEDTVDLLDPEGRAWLRDTLETWFPGHPWLERLQASSDSLPNKQ
jgi:hypothetical protein